jgi:hypothetical protein
MSGRAPQYLRDGHMGEAVYGVQAAYQLDPTEVEIINHFGYAYLLGYAYLRPHDPEAAGQTLQPRNHV